MSEDNLYNGLKQIQGIDVQLTVKTLAGRDAGKTSYKIFLGDPTKEDGMRATKVGDKIIYKGMLERINPGLNLDKFKKKFTDMQTLQDLVVFLETFSENELPTGHVFNG